MKIPADWLNQFLSKPLDTRELAEALERAGVEVEKIEYAQALDKLIVVGLVKKVVQHPRADSLKLTQVDVGGRILAIVCGAPNVAVGMKVAVAPVGAKLPDGMEIKAVSLRGEVSQGMLCSARELGLSDDHSGIMVLDPTLLLGTTLCDIWPASDILDVTTAMNRSDLTSLWGLSREVAAQSGRRVMEPQAGELPSGEAPAVKLAAGKRVRRFLAVRLNLPPVGPSPAAMQKRLAASGLRPINAVVDITNYVMWEYGQPLHAFDAAKLNLPLTVRSARPGETLVTLDGQRRQLTEQDMVVADQTGPVGLAGVMGGAGTEITTATSAIILEAATFSPAGVRKTALHHGLRSEASSRFERGLPTQLPPLALARAVQLLQEWAGAEVVGGVADIELDSDKATRVVKASATQVTGLLGLTLSPSRLRTELNKLDLATTTVGDNLTVRVPWWRPDLTMAADMAEEVVKLIGYEQVPSTLPPWRPVEVEFDNYSDLIWQIKDRLVGLGHFEVATYAFVSARQLQQQGHKLQRHLQLRNPKSSEQAYLRSDLLPSLLDAAARNQNYAKRFGLFEISRVFTVNGKTSGPTESIHLAVLVRDDRLAYAGVKQVLDLLERELRVELTVAPQVHPALHPARAARVKLGTAAIGWIGEVDPRLLRPLKLDGAGYIELDLEQLVAAARPPRYQATNPYPPVKRDITLLAPRRVGWVEIERATRVLDLAKVTFNGDYYGSELPPDTKTITLRLELSASDRTLTDTEADERVVKLVHHLEKSLGISLRE